MTGTRLAAVLRAGGLHVIESPGWLTHNRNHKGAWGEVEGVMHHHTVTRGDTPQQTQASVALCFDGHATLPGPLCHGVISKDGTVYLVGNGRANHAGTGDDAVLRAMLAGRPLPDPVSNSRDGNRLFYGFESINLGDGVDPWPRAQVLAMEMVSVAISREHGWDEGRSLAHQEWQRGKIDPRGPGFPGMDTLRANIKTRLRADERDDMAVTEDDIRKIAQATARAVAEFQNPNLEPRRDLYQVIRDGAADAKRAADRAVEIRGAVDRLDLTGMTPAALDAIATAVADEIARRGAE
jgi:hypothetical protein